MANKRNRTRHGKPKARPMHPVHPIEDLLADVENAQVHPGLDIEGEDNAPIAVDAPEDLRVLRRLREGWASALRSKDLWRRATERADKREADLEAQDHALRDEKLELTKLKTNLAERERVVVEDERLLEDKRAEAAAGFASEQAKATEHLRNKRDTLQVEINDLEEELANRRAVGASEERAALARDRAQLAATVRISTSLERSTPVMPRLSPPSASFSRTRRATSQGSMRRIARSLRQTLPYSLHDRSGCVRKRRRARNQDQRRRTPRCGPRPSRRPAERLVDVNARLTAQVDALQDQLANVPDEAQLADLRAAADRTRQAELDAGEELAPPTG